MSPDPLTFLERYDYQTVVALKARLRQREAQLWAILTTHGPLRVPGDVLDHYDPYRSVVLSHISNATNEWIFSCPDDQGPVRLRHVPHSGGRVDGR